MTIIAAYVSDADPAAFRVFEVYKDEAAGVLHEKSAHFATLVNELKESLEGGLAGLNVEKAKLLIE